jgi:hypothetical protein
MDEYEGLSHTKWDCKYQVPCGVYSEVSPQGAV